MLGSQERYEQLKESPLVRPDTMHIVYDLRAGKKLYWVGMHIHGEVTGIEGRTITIENNEETIALYAPEWAFVSLDKIVKGRRAEAKFEDIKLGSQLVKTYVVMNANTWPNGEARHIVIAIP